MISADKLVSVTKTITYRKLRAINVNSFREDITSSDLSDSLGDLDVLADRYDATLRSLVDKHAPLCQRNTPLGILRSYVTLNRNEGY